MSRPYAPGRAKSCTACRQVKLACDSRKKAPEPCSRCIARNLECRFDKDFKRIPTRRIAQEITNGIHHLDPASDSSVPTLLRTSLTTSCSSDGTPRPTHHVPSSQSLAHRLTGTHTPHPDVVAQEQVSWLNVQDSQESITFYLEDVSLRPEIAIELFRRFERYYYPHIPVLKPVNSLASFASESPLLFWTIVLVASQRHDELEGIYLHLYGPLENLLSRILLTSIQSVEIVQALLLLCLWPIPKAKEQHDPSWNYLGMAHNAAMQINLHSPISKDGVTRSWTGWGDAAKKSYSSEYLSSNWLSCFDLGIRLSTYLGMPPPLSTPHLLGTVKEACLQVSSLLPSNHRALLGIRQITASSTSHLQDLSDDSSHSAHFGLTRYFDRQLDDIKADHSTCWTPSLEIDLQGAKLYLYAMTLALSAAGDPNRSLHCESALQKALPAATTLVASMRTLSLTATDSNCYPAGALTFYPKQSFTTLFFAAAILFRFLSNSYTASHQDRELAMTGLMDAHKILQSFDRDRDHVRAALHIETFVEMLRSQSAADRRSSSFTDLVVTSRLGASVMWDAVFCAARHRNRRSANGESGAPGTWQTLNDDSADRLPLAPKERGATIGPPANNPSTSDMRDTSWLEPWNAYIMDFGLGVEQLDMLDTSMMPGMGTGWDPDAIQLPVDQAMQPW